MSQLIKLFMVVVAGAWFGVTSINAQIQSNSSTDEARLRQVVQQIQNIIDPLNDTNQHEIFLVLFRVLSWIVCRYFLIEV